MAYDDEQGQMAWAAACLAAPGPIFCKQRGSYHFYDPWPWRSGDTRPRDRHGRLSKRAPEEQLLMLKKAKSCIEHEIARLEKLITQGGEHDLALPLPGGKIAG